VVQRSFQLRHVYVFVFQEIRQHVSIGPSWISGLCPTVEVPHVTPRVHVVVDYRTAAQAFARRPRTRPVHQAFARVQLLFRVVRPIVIRELQIMSDGWDRRYHRFFSAGFQQQYVPFRHFGQSTGHCRSGSSGADYYEIVLVQYQFVSEQRVFAELNQVLTVRLSQVLKDVDGKTRTDDKLNNNQDD